MKNTLQVKTLMVLLLILGITACEKSEPKVRGCTDKSATNYNPKATESDNSCNYVGNITFWYNSVGSNATVRVNGQVGTISKYYSTTPQCNSVGCANFQLPPGSYPFTAESTFNKWSGSVTVVKNDCRTTLLTN
jgi:hypothetical protein